METATGSQPFVEMIEFDALAPEGRDLCRSLIVWMRAASTSWSSERPNASGLASRAATSTRAADRERSPASSARRVAGICVRALARWVCPRAVPHATWNRVASTTRPRCGRRVRTAGAVRSPRGVEAVRVPGARKPAGARRSPPRCGHREGGGASPTGELRRRSAARSCGGVTVQVVEHTFDAM